MIRFPYLVDLHTGVPCWRPIVPVIVKGFVVRRRARAVVDTGSNDSIFPAKLANVLGIALGTSISHALVWHGQSFPLQFATVDLELSDGWAGFRWSASVGFSAAPIPYALLGIRGCLQFFDATFCGKDLAVEFTINQSFPGTVC
jgi:hypothetical protein